MKTLTAQSSRKIAAPVVQSPADLHYVFLSLATKLAVAMLLALLLGYALGELDLVPGSLKSLIDPAHYAAVSA